MTASAREWMARLVAAALGAGAVLAVKAMQVRQGSPASERDERSTQQLQVQRATSAPGSAPREPAADGIAADPGNRAPPSSAEDVVQQEQGGQRLQQLSGQLQAAQRERDSLQRGKQGMSSEGQRFEADLAESFGPEDAQRIWRSLNCSSSRG